MPTYCFNCRKKLTYKTSGSVFQRICPSLSCRYCMIDIEKTTKFYSYILYFNPKNNEKVAAWIGIKELKLRVAIDYENKKIGFEGWKSGEIIATIDDLPELSLTNRKKFVRAIKKITKLLSFV